MTSLCMKIDMQNGNQQLCLGLLGKVVVHFDMRKRFLGFLDLLLVLGGFFHEFRTQRLCSGEDEMRGTKLAKMPLNSCHFHGGVVCTSRTKSFTCKTSACNANMREAAKTPALKP